VRRQLTTGDRVSPLPGSFLPSSSRPSPSLRVRFPTGFPWYRGRRACPGTLRRGINPYRSFTFSDAVPPAAGAGVSRTAASPRRIAGGVSRPEGRAAAGDRSMVLLRCRKHKAGAAAIARGGGCKHLCAAEQEIRAAASISPEDGGEWAGGALGDAAVLSQNSEVGAPPRSAALLEHDRSTTSPPGAGGCSGGNGRWGAPACQVRPRGGFSSVESRAISKRESSRRLEHRREAPHPRRGRCRRETMSQSWKRDFYGG
jgi:hypothetical protein